MHCREIEVGALLARRRHPNYLFEAHSIPDHPVRRRWMRAALLGSLGIVAITDGLAADLAEAFGVARGEILVAPDAFEARAFASLPARDAARAALAIPTDRFVVLYAGHLFPWKGADTLLAAAARIPTIHFLFVGGLPEDVERLRGARAAPATSRSSGTGRRPRFPTISPPPTWSRSPTPESSRSRRATPPR